MLLKALMEKYLGKEFAVSGDKIIKWPSGIGPKPDQAGIYALIAGYAYKEKRKAAYPAIGDQLDAIMKQFNQDRLDGKALIQDLDDQLGLVLAVKAAHPKPGA